MSLRASIAMRESPVSRLPFWLLSAYFFLFSLAARAEVRAPRYFTNYGINQGLSQNTVRCILQDSTGFVWVGTHQGLNRFDGVEFKHYAQLPGCIVTALFQDRGGLLWVGTNAGVTVYNPQTDTFTPLRQLAKGADNMRNEVKCICADPQGRIVISCDQQGVFVCEEDSVRQVLDAREAHIGTINSIAFDAAGNAWLGTFGQGVYTASSDFSHLQRFTDAEGRDPFGNAVVQKVARQGERIYVCTEKQGLFAVHPQSRRTEQVFRHDAEGHIPFIRDLLFRTATDLWIGTETGLYTLDLTTAELHHYTHSYDDAYSLSDNAIYSLYQDRDGGVWIGSYFGGVDYLSARGHLFERYHKGTALFREAGQRIRELCEAPDGSIWIGSEDGGVGCFSHGRFELLPESRDFTNVHALCIDEGKLWIGTFGKGLKVLDLQTRRLSSITVFSGKGMVSDYIFSIHRDAAGTLWLGTMSGLQRYDRKADRFETEQQLANIFCYVVTEDAHHTLWVGTYASGLYCRRAGTGTWKHYTHDDAQPASLPSDRVIGICEDSDGRVWVMTQEGPVLYDPQHDRFTPSPTLQYGIAGTVYQMVEDDLGQQWFTTNNGLYMVQPRQQTVHHYDTSDGLTSNQFNYASSLRTADGTVYLGSIDGLISFRPTAESHRQRPLPRPVVTDMLLFDERLSPATAGSPLTQAISNTASIRLASDQNTLTFRVSSLLFSEDNEIEIKYRLTGCDPDWRYVRQKDAVFTYPNLRYGTYVLQAVTVNRATGEESEMRELTVCIKTPFRLTAWAFMLYFLIVAAALGLAFRYYVTRNRQRTQQKVQEARRQQEREAYDQKISFFTHIAHEIRTPLTLIKAPLDCVFQRPSVRRDKDTMENLDVVSLNVERLLELVNQLLDFRKMEGGNLQLHRQPCDISRLLNSVLERFAPTVEKSGMRLHTQFPATPLQAVVDAEAVTKIVSNLMTNAIKYGQSRIEVALTEQGKHFTLTVSNDGNIVGQAQREEIFKPFTRLDASGTVAGTGIGLSYARNLAHMLGGTLQMDGNLAANTFVLRLPTDAQPDAVQSETQETEDLDRLIARSSAMARLLLVEDNAELTDMLAKQLQTRGYDVLTAQNGAEALQLLGEQAVDLVVTDVMMPEMDGFELLRLLRADAAHATLPVILLSAKTELTDKLEGLHLGADAYIEKPFSFEYLAASVASLLRNRQRAAKDTAETALPQKTVGLNEVDRNFVAQLNDIIKANSDNPQFSMEDVFGQMGLSRTSFYRKVKGLLNQSPNDYIRLYRLKRAAELFQAGHTNVTEVSALVGFSSSSYFSKCFQQQFGHSPKEAIKRAQS